MALARLWAKVKVFHPWMQYKDVDWDSAFVRALPKVEAASTSDEFEAAVQSMLDELGDPVTRLVAGVSGPGSLRRPKSPWWPRTDVLLIDLSHLGWGPRDFAGSRQQVSALPELAASVVVFDLRGGGPTHENVQTFFGTLVDWGQLPAADRWPSERRVQYTGYPSHNPDFTMDGAEARMVEVASRPPSRTQRARPERVVFIVDGQSTLPYVAIALQQADRARIVAAGRMPQPPVTTMTVWLATGVRAEVRTGELLLPDGTGEVRPDIQVAANEDPLPKALDLAANSPWPKRAVRWAECLPKARRRYDAIYPDTKLPSRELRVLAVVRLWTAIEHFYGYPQLLDRWDEVLVEFIPRAEEAHAADAYVKVLLEMGALIEDSHVELWGSPVLDELFGEAGIPVSVRIVEGKPIVVQLPSDDAQIAGLEIGDEIVGVDGEPAAERMQHFERYVSASTPDARQQALARLLLRGKDGSLASVALRGADGRVRTVSMTRTRKPWPGSPSSPKYRLLPGNIGYVDLRTLTVGDVDAMFEALGGARALIFDMRGYPQGSAWAIAPRLNVRGATCFAQFRGRLVTYERPEVQGERYEFCQRLEDDPRPKYRGRTFMLIDDRAISQAEHTGLFFEAAAGTMFVGSPTAGTNGGVTNLNLPGGLYMSFTQIDVRHADGRQLQRVGLQPDVLVRPTIEGIRTGRDEVLEAAIALANQ